jgi:hypothetical protein
VCWGCCRCMFLRAVCRQCCQTAMRNQGVRHVRRFIRRTGQVCNAAPYLSWLSCGKRLAKAANVPAASRCSRPAAVLLLASSASRSSQAA